MSSALTSTSLPLPGQGASPLTPRPPTSFNGATPRRTRLEHLRPAASGPGLVVTLVGGNFKQDGRYALTLSACGSQHHMPLSEGRCFQVPTGQTYNFPLGDHELDLALKISATRITGLPQLSPRGVMANNLEEECGWEEEVGSTTLTLEQLLCMPQPAGGTDKHHEVQLFSGSDGRRGGALVGVVLLKWTMEDRVAEAKETAQRATELLKQRLATAAAERDGAYANGRRKQKARPAPLQLPSAGPASAGPARFMVGAGRERVAPTDERVVRTSQRAGLVASGLGQRPAAPADDTCGEVGDDSPADDTDDDDYDSWAEQEVARQEEADEFDKQMILAKWADVLMLYRIVLWLPEGSTPGSVPMSARQACGLSDLAAKHKSGMVAFTHGGARVTLSRETAASLRQVLEDKLILQPRQLAEDCKHPINLTMSDGAVSNRGATAAVGTDAKNREEGGSSSAAEPRHLTAQPTTRPRAPPHPMSTNWLEAAVLPFRPTSPRVGPSPKAAALLRANQPDAATTHQSGGSQLGAFAAMVPSPPARVLPPTAAPKAKSPRRSPTLDITE